MESTVKVDAGICGFKTVIKASSEDSMNVELKVVSSCDTIKELASLELIIAAISVRTLPT